MRVDEHGNPLDDDNTSQNTQENLDENNENKDTTKEEQDQYTIDPEALVSEMEALKAQNAELADSINDYESRWNDREDEFQRKISEQGQHIGQLKKFITNNIDDQSGRQRGTRTQFDGIKSDPAFDPKGYAEDVNSAFQAINDRLDNQQPTGISSELAERLDSIDQKFEDMQRKSLQKEYNAYLIDERKQLKEVYGLSRRDIKQVENFANSSGSRSLIAAALENPKTRDKAALNYANRQNNQEKPDYRKKYYKKRQQSENLQNEFANSGNNSVPGGGSSGTEDNHDWMTEMRSAIADNSFWDWPIAKQKEYEAKLARQERQEADNN
jgi:hypothetical protein